MRERITVRVTQEHIERGKRGDWECCPVALAIAEVLADEEKGKWYTARREVAIRIMPDYRPHAVGCVRLPSWLLYSATYPLWPPSLQGWVSK